MAFRSRLHRIVWIAFAFALVPGCSDSDDPPVLGPDRIVGSGVLAQEVRVIPDFTSTDLGSVGRLRLRLGGAPSLSVSAEDNLLAHLVTAVSGGVLTIQTAIGVDIVQTMDIDYDATFASSLDGVRLSGVGEIDAQPLVAATVSLTLTGVGDIRATAIDATTLDGSLTGVGSMVLAGSTDRQNVVATGVGTYDAELVTSIDTYATVDDACEVIVHATRDLVIEFVGNGTVRYVGTPNLQVTGTGTVVPL